MKYIESEKVELKASTSELKEAIISISAILNKHSKGKIYFGIKDDSTFVGQAIGKNTLREISRAISEHIEPRIFPKVSANKANKKMYIEVEFSGQDIPYFAYGRAYMRVGDENRQLSARELENLILKKNKIFWENGVSEKSLKDINVDTVKNYIARANEAKRINFKFSNIKTVLHKLNLSKGNKLLKSAEVLFCDDNLMEVQAAVFAGTDKLTFLDIKKFKGNIFNLKAQSETYIKEHMNWRANLEGSRREEIPEISVRAITEAIVNSLCHRDYANPKGNEIAIFKDRIEIYNPGQFPEEATPEDFIKGKEHSILRNPLIAETLYKSSDIEKWGSGLKRIYEECEKYKIKVEFQCIKTGFVVIFYKSKKKFSEKLYNKDAGKGTVKITAKVPEKSQKSPRKIPDKYRIIINTIKENPQLSRKELSIQLNETEETIQSRLRKLVKEKIIKRIGPDKGGYWKVLK
ncbi:MAG: ATP-binding protein [bacterium]|nr:ATP-binding protein [bacterium]